MKAKNKTIVFLGSSVTYGAASGGYSMCEYVRDTMAANTIKWAVSGTTLSTAKPNSYIERMLAEMGSLDKCDLFITQLSTNDAAGGIELGVISSSFDKDSFDTDTVTGAIEFIIATAREKWGCPIAFYTGTYFESEKYQKMVDALADIAKKWNVGIVDLWNSEKMRSVSAEDYERFMADGVHPKLEGYTEWWGPEFVRYIEDM